MTLAVKTGMTVEQGIVEKYVAKDVIVLTGEYDAAKLDATLPTTVDAIISVGVCGALSTHFAVAQGVICNVLKTPNGRFTAEPTWGFRLASRTKFTVVPWWSSGEFNTANTVDQRAALFKQTGCDVIDDESFAVAQFAATRKIPFQCMRTISDGATKASGGDLPPAIANALNANGSDNIGDVLKSIWTEPIDPLTGEWQVPELIEVYAKAKSSYDSLGTGCLRAGPYLQFKK